jgi:rod shape determining protein RodA
MIALQLVVNVGMVVGLMPVVGIPLPLLSYGGSSLVVTCAGIGLVMSVRMRRFLY